MRYPAFSGVFYHKTFNELDQQIRECFNSGPGDLFLERKNKKLFGIIAPNQRYSESGSCAAWAFKEIAESEFPDTYIIISSNEEGTYVSTEDWETPMGKVKVDIELANLLKQNLNFVRENNNIHKNQREIEVQLPFLQFVSRDNLHSLKVLPLTICGLNLEQIKELADLLETLDRKICLIISTNVVDLKITKLIENMESSLNLKEYLPIIAGIEISKSFGCKSANLLKQQPNGAAIVFE